MYKDKIIEAARAVLKGNDEGFLRPHRPEEMAALRDAIKAYDAWRAGLMELAFNIEAKLPRKLTDIELPWMAAIPEYSGTPITMPIEKYLEYQAFCVQHGKPEGGQFPGPAHAELRPPATASRRRASSVRARPQR